MCAGSTDGLEKPVAVRGLRGNWSFTAWRSFLLVTHFAAHRVWPRSTLVADVCRCMIRLPVADVAPSRRGVLVRRPRRPGSLDRQLVERRRSHPIQAPLPADATRCTRTNPNTGRSVERCGMTSVARRTRRLTSRSRPWHLRDDRPQEVVVQQRQRPHTRAESATRSTPNLRRHSRTTR